MIGWIKMKKEIKWKWGRELGGESAWNYDKDEYVNEACNLNEHEDDSWVV